MTSLFKCARVFSPLLKCLKETSNPPILMNGGLHIPKKTVAQLVANKMDGTNNLSAQKGLKHTYKGSPSGGSFMWEFVQQYCLYMAASEALTLIFFILFSFGVFSGDFAALLSVGFFASCFPPLLTSITTCSLVSATPASAPQMKKKKKIETR